MVSVLKMLKVIFFEELLDIVVGDNDNSVIYSV